MSEPLAQFEPADTAHMRRAIALALRAAGGVAQNPMVGCVLTRDGKVIGEGYHDGPGTPHAERAAIAAAAGRADGATAYVTLEPCNHYGNTPPCTEGLIEAGIAHVIYACTDPNPIAAGGADRLRAAGITVRSGLCEDEALWLIRPWLHALTAARPYVYAKLAQTLDGRTATRTGDSKWITGAAARAQGHMLRQRTDAILVGVGTVLADDPGLDPRPDGMTPIPSRKVVLDTHLRTPASARLLRSPGPVTIFCDSAASAGQAEALKAAGAEICTVPSGPRGLSLDHVLAELRMRECRSVMVEGGGTLLGAFFDQGLVDEVWAFLAPIILGGGKPAIAGEGPLLLADAAQIEALTQTQLGQDTFIRVAFARSEAISCSQAS